jgi:hypothetical protein
LSFLSVSGTIAVAIMSANDFLLQKLFKTKAQQGSKKKHLLDPA